jgi:hypothetical protein
MTTKFYYINGFRLHTAESGNTLFKNLLRDVDFSNVEHLSWTNIDDIAQLIKDWTALIVENTEKELPVIIAKSTGCNIALQIKELLLNQKNIEVKTILINPLFDAEQSTNPDVHHIKNHLKVFSESDIKNTFILWSTNDEVLNHKKFSESETIKTNNYCVFDENQKHNIKVLDENNKNHILKYLNN